MCVFSFLLPLEARLAQRPALAQQIPALVELDFHGAQPLMLFGLVDLVMLQLGAEIFLLRDELVHLGEDVFVVGHAYSLPSRAV